MEKKWWVSHFANIFNNTMVKQQARWGTTTPKVSLCEQNWWLPNTTSNAEFGHSHRPLESIYCAAFWVWKSHPTISASWNLVAPSNRIFQTFPSRALLPTVAYSDVHTLAHPSCASFWFHANKSQIPLQTPTKTVFAFSKPTHRIRGYLNPSFSAERSVTS